LIHESNEGSYHFIHGFRLYLEDRLGIRIKATKFWGDIHFSCEELTWTSMVHEHFTGCDSPFWLICTGGKRDYTAKWWIPEFAQEVVDHFKDRIQFVQFGAEGSNHEHPLLNGVINLVGKTDIRMFMRLMYHASGVVCPVTFAMHLAAAMQAKPGLPLRKACVVTAGGREPSLFTAYPHHVYLHANGQMLCCQNGGCWKSRITPLNDGDEKDLELCVDTVNIGNREVQRCMHDLVTAQDVIRAIERYYRGGALKYLSSDRKTIEAAWEQRKTS
jgi:ADP-heptose:LPS heptosyltransferase